MNRDNAKDPTPYAVWCSRNMHFRNDKLCGNNGLVFLSEEEYSQQMRSPNSRWQCPKCLSLADWDDDCQTTNPPEEFEGDDDAPAF